MIALSWIDMRIIKSELLNEGMFSRCISRFTIIANSTLIDHTSKDQSTTLLNLHGNTTAKVA
jgi:hypothetical protein